MKRAVPRYGGERDCDAERPRQGVPTAPGPAPRRARPRRDEDEGPGTHPRRQGPGRRGRRRALGPEGRRPARPLTRSVAVAERDPYVSRGGHKLAAALDAFEIDPAGLVCLDVGASTGGFTDVLLQRGAARVYAVDVGRGQLAEALGATIGSSSMERLNARTLTATTLPEPIDLAVVDVSFISLGLVLGPVASTLRPGARARIVALVKPQFEAGRGRTDHGVVRDPAVHREVLERVIDQARGMGLGAQALIASPILGPEGNREFLVASPPRRRAAPTSPTTIVAVTAP